MLKLYKALYFHLKALHIPFRAQKKNNMAENE